MSKFYTNVTRFGNNLLYRGYEDGRRVKKKIKFSPTLFLKGKGNSKYHTLDGINVDPKKFESMSEAKAFAESYADVENFKIYGNTNYIAQYITQNFPEEIHFDRKLIRIHTIDIEVMSNAGFPEPSKAEHEVTSVTIHDSVYDKYIIWGCGDYDSSKRLRQECNVMYIKCPNEVALLKQVVEFWSNEFTCPDALTGWNIRTFDIPYLINRIIRLLGEDAAKSISPWNHIEEKQVSMMKGTVQVYDIQGIAQLDYLDLFKKFGYTYGNQETYRLDHIANVVLGEKKLSYDEYSNLHELYVNDYQKYIDYNMRDVWLVVSMEDKIAYLTVALTIAYKAGAQYSDTFGTVAVWDALIHKFLWHRNIIVPPTKSSPKISFEGAYVKPPLCGVHDWIVSFDVNSMHPNLFVQLNMSPETLLKGEFERDVDVQKMVAGYMTKSEHSMSATGQYFSKHKRGAIPEIIIALYSERVDIKGRMLELKKQKQTVDKTNLQEYYAIEREIAHAENMQLAIKILLNSLFGASGNRFFRYYAIEIAESITISSQYVIQWAEKHINGYLNKILNTNNEDYVIAIDTDSTYVAFDKLVRAVFGEVDRKDEAQVSKVIDFLDKVSKKIESEVLAPAFEQLAINTNSFDNRIVMKREAIADRGIWTAKKRYILNVRDNEGVRYTEPELKVMGIEAIKSSTPAICREAFLELFKILINGSELETREYIENFRKIFNASPAEDKAFPRGVNDVKGYMDKHTIYKKGTPINSRAAIMYNHLINEHDLHNKYQLIRDGDKIKFIFLNPRNPTRENVIGFIDRLPTEFELHRYIDNDTQFEKTFLDPTVSILDAIGWKLEDESTLDSFFG